MTELSPLEYLLKKREAVDEQIALCRQKERGEAIAQALEIIKKYDLQASDLFNGNGNTGKRAKRAPAKPKYRNPETGQTWTGRGIPPLWIRDKDKSQFLIQ